MPIALRRLLVVIVAVLAIYLVGGNLFVNSPQARDWVNAKPERLQASWSKGLTWFPGVLMLWDVKLQGHARTLRWQASADRLHGGINLIALRRRELRGSWMQVTQAEGSADVVANDLLPPPNDENAWLLHFSSIHSSSLKQLRFNGSDIRGDGSASIGFVKQLRGGPLEMLPSRIRFDDASIRHDGRTALRSGSVELDFAIPRHWRDDAPGLKKVAIASGHLTVDGDLPLLGFKLDATRRWHGLFGGNDGNARIKADVTLAKAELQPGSEVEISAPLTGSTASAAFNDIASLRAELVGDDAKLVLQLPPPPQGGGSANGELRIAGARLELPRDWANLIARSSGHFDMDWHFDALDWLDPLLAESRWLQPRGAGDVSARLKLKNGVLEHGSSVDVPRVDLGVLVAEHRFHGSASAKARVVAATGTPGRLEIASALAAYDVAAADAPDASLLRGKDLRFDVDASSDLARLRDTIKARLQFRRAEMPDIRAFNRYLPTGSVVLLAGSNRLDGDVRVDGRGKVAAADIAMQGNGTKARLGAIQLAGNFDVAARLVASKSSPGQYQLDGSRLRIEQLVVGEPGHVGGKPTWATLALPRSSVTPGRPWTIDADADIRMQDIRLLLGLFSKERAFPKWVIKLADAGVLRATGLMRSQGDTLTFDRVLASNDRFDAAARMRVAAGRPKGDLLLQWGALSLGLEVDGDERDFKLIRARHWYESRPDLLPRSAAGPTSPLTGPVAPVAR